MSRVRETVEATTIGLYHVPPALLRGTNPLGQKMMAKAVEVAGLSAGRGRHRVVRWRKPCAG